MPYAQEKVLPYGARGEKGPLVRQMFDNIAPTYDRLNRRLSWTLDGYWRRRAVRAIASAAPQTILDIATGTADLALMAARQLQPQSIFAADISDKMMAIGQAKVAAAGLADVITFATEDCMHLSFAADTFDAVTAAFGLRNFQSLDTCVAEVLRVLRPGGIFAAVELTMPQRFPLRQLFTLYARQVIPRCGQTLAGDKGAYEYLSQSIAAFPPAGALCATLRRAGFTTASATPLTGGVCTLYKAIK